jgi:hypothetical protein
VSLKQKTHVIMTSIKKEQKTRRTEDNLEDRKNAGEDEEERQPYSNSVILIRIQIETRTTKI